MAVKMVFPFLIHTFDATKTIFFENSVAAATHE